MSWWMSLPLAWCGSAPRLQLSLPSDRRSGLDWDQFTKSLQFNFICIALLTKELCHKAALQRTGPQWVSQGQQWQGKTPWQITEENLEQNQTQRGTICRWLAPVLVQCFESVLSPVMLGWGDSGRMRVPSWSRLDLRARRGRSGDLG